MSGRAGSRPKRANARSRRPARSSGRIGLPVTTTFPAGNAAADAAKVTATRSREPADQPVGEPRHDDLLVDEERAAPHGGRHRGRDRDEAAGRDDHVGAEPPEERERAGRSPPAPGASGRSRCATRASGGACRSGSRDTGCRRPGTQRRLDARLAADPDQSTPSPSRARSASASARPADGVASGAASGQDDRHGPPREACRLVPAGSARLLHPARFRGRRAWPAAASGHGARGRARSGARRAPGRGGRVASQRRGYAEKR